MMQEEIASFLKYQMERGVKRGGVEDAAAILHRFLEMERSAHALTSDLKGAERKIANLPRLRTVQS